MEISAGESGLGKTELGIALALLAQKCGTPSVYFDYGGNLNKNQLESRAAAWGVASDGVIIVRPSSYQDITNVGDTIKDVKLIVIDDLPSVAITGEDPAVAARRAIRILLMGCPNATLLLVNQTRYLGTRYGSYLEEFMNKVCQARLSLSPAGILRDRASMIGHRLQIKVHYPQEQREDQVFKLYHTYSQGIDPEMNTLITLVKLGIIEKKGEHFSFEGNTLGQGLLLASRGLKRQNLLGKLLEVGCQPSEYTITLVQ